MNFDITKLLIILLTASCAISSIAVILNVSATKALIKATLVRYKKSGRQ